MRCPVTIRGRGEHGGEAWEQEVQCELDSLPPHIVHVGHLHFDDGSPMVEWSITPVRIGHPAKAHLN